MKNKHFLSLVLLGVATIFAACDPNETFYPEWIGDYSIQSIKIVNPNGEYTELLIEEGLVREGDPFGYVSEREKSYEEYPTLSIFKDNGLYVQTLGIGDPFIPHVDPEEHILIARSPKRIGAGSDSIDTVEPSAGPNIIIENGGVYTYYNGLKISPKPIKVLRASSDSLVLKNGEPFDVTLTNADGSAFMTAHNYWTYSPIKKENDICTFDAELHVNYDTIYQSGIFRSHLVFHKK